MKMDNHFPEKSGIIFEKEFVYFFVNVDISLTMRNLNLKLCTCTKNISIEETVSQIFHCLKKLYISCIEKKTNV